MKNFKDFGIYSTSKAFVGTKIEIHNILNTDINVHEYRIADSKFQKDKVEKCLHLQISIGEIKHVIFSGSVFLIDAIQQVPKDGFPFTTKIVKDNKRYMFI